MPRIFWFLVGAGVATWWSKHKHCMRYDYQTTRSITHMHPNGPPGGNANLNSSSEPPVGNQIHDWEVERARIRDVSRQAGDTVAELSEATLETLLSTVQTLKAKIAEHRAQRELEQATLNEERQEPRRLV